MAVIRRAGPWAALLVLACHFLPVGGLHKKTSPVLTAAPCLEVRCWRASVGGGEVQGSLRLRGGGQGQLDAAEKNANEEEERIKGILREKQRHKCLPMPVVSPLFLFVTGRISGWEAAEFAVRLRMFVLHLSIFPTLIPLPPPLPPWPPPVCPLTRLWCRTT